MKSWLTGKDSDAGSDWGQEEKGTTEDEMAGWRHWLDGRESEWTPGIGDGQGGLACCNSWGRKELDRTEQLNWTDALFETYSNLKVQFCNSTNLSNIWSYDRDSWEGFSIEKSEIFRVMIYRVAGFWNRLHACLILCDPMDCSLPETLQTRTLGRTAAMPSSRESSWLSKPMPLASPASAGGFRYHWCHVGSPWNRLPGV